MLRNCPICGNSISKSIPARHLPHFLRCPDCSGYYHNEENGNPIYYNTYFTDESSPTLLGKAITNFLDLYLLIYERKIKKLISSKDSHILDYGCGNGKFVAFLKNRGFQVAGFDPSASAINLAQGSKLPVFKEIPPKKYDLVMFWHSLEHTDQPLSDLEKLKEKHLAPGSKLLIAVPNGDSLEAHVAGNKWFGYDWPFHRIHFTRRSLDKMLDRAGFRIVTADHWNLNYALASLTQSFLNLFLTKNILYSMVSNRRVTRPRAVILLGGIFSLAVLLIASPLLLVVFMLGLLTKKTGTMIVTAEPISSA